MSIHPQYAAAIMAGTKRVEFRKRQLANDVDTVVVYATLPVGAVVGTFTLAGADVDSPESLWRRHGHHGGIERGAYDAYFHARDRAVAIRVGEVQPLSKPLPLAAVGAVTAPQSFQYLPRTALLALRPTPDEADASFDAWPAALASLLVRNLARFASTAVRAAISK